MLLSKITKLYVESQRNCFKNSLDSLNKLTMEHTAARDTTETDIFLNKRHPAINIKISTKKKITINK